MLALAIALVIAPIQAPEVERKLILQNALDEVQRSIAYYEKAVEAQDKKWPFRWVVRQKRRHEKRILKLFDKHGIKASDPQWNPDRIRVPPQRVGACASGVEHELRNAAIYERALDRLTGGTRSVFWRLHRRVRYKHLTAFERCVHDP